MQITAYVVFNNIFMDLNNNYSKKKDYKLKKKKIIIINFLL